MLSPVPILLYHAVTADPPGWIAPCAVSPARPGPRALELRHTQLRRAALRSPRRRSPYLMKAVP